MTRTKRASMVVVAALLLTSLSVPCSAADSAFRDVFENAFYGGLVGSLVGGALLVFTKKPADHADYVYYGAAGGILTGAAYGVAKTSRALVSMDDGNMKFAMPTIIPEFQETGTKGASALVLKAELIRGHF